MSGVRLVSSLYNVIVRPGRSPREILTGCICSRRLALCRSTIRLQIRYLSLDSYHSFLCQTTVRSPNQYGDLNMTCLHGHKVSFRSSHHS